MSDRYTVLLSPPARRALAAGLPEDVAAAAGELITNAIAREPWKVGKPLQELTPGALIHNVPDALFFSLVMGFGSFLAWSVAWNSKIRATPDALFVDNIYVVHEIPWRRVSPCRSS
ncbi:hypothetical protein OG320_26665 [Microbispora sp. NBC_01189]|uniref:hypothetical protein n=1 Tax=Microbispora sp. NBC_01189 TaxID=2903583 RepID=UPI002E13B4C0|nr:hypothetical protein OG320_26665 [Microbispora sp. NBC_01189]